MKRLKIFFLLGFLFSITFYGNAKNSKSRTIIHLTKSDFLKKVHNFETNKVWKYLGNKPSIIDFYADWCGPCRKLTPILNEFAVKHPEIIIYKVNVDEQPELADYFRASSIPLLVYIPVAGSPVQELGLVTESEIEQRASKLFNKSRK